jgi:hypothetical protein
VDCHRLLLITEEYPRVVQQHYHHTHTQHHHIHLVLVLEVEVVVVLLINDYFLTIDRITGSLP